MATWKKIIVSGSSAELNNLVVDNHVSASELSGSFFGDGSGLTGITATGLDIDNFGSDLTSITIAGTDKIALSDNGTEGRVNVSQLATPLAGTGLEASSGTIRIATAAAGTGLTGGGGSALEVDFTDATFQSNVSGAFDEASASFASDIAGITTSFTISGSTGSDTFNSGETLIFTGGTSLTSAVTNNEVTINVDAGGITETQLNTSVAGSGLAGGAGSALSVNVDDSSIEINTDTLRVKAGGISNAMIAAGAVTSASIAADAVESVHIADQAVVLGTQTTGAYVDSLGTGTGVTIGANTGEGSNPTIAVDYGSTANTAVQGNTNITINGTSGEIGVTGTAAQALGGGPTYTITLPDTITGDRTFSNNVTISGDLTVTGDTIEQQVTNLNVEDRFILLNSGSAAADAGFVVNGQGSAFGWDESASRFAFDFAGATWNQTTSSFDAFAAAVVTSDDANYRYNGNIRIDGEDIYIYVE